MRFPSTLTRFTSIASLAWLACVATLAGAAEADLPAKVEFNRDIRPIMSDTCFHCHGPDAKSREAGMRLDLRDEALKMTKTEAVPIVPGQPDQSEIITRIFETDEPMPPETAHKPLTARQKALMKRWVEQGAVYEPHWAYAPLKRPALPAGGKKRNPIDAFIEAKLAEKNLTLSPEAPMNRLLRRVSLDLTGLPPTPEELAAGGRSLFGNAYAKQVDRLLASAHFGERMAVWWLDIARFADTVGFHGDQFQRIFPYRDYVINAFNANKRFDQFTIEQLAGDLLPNPTQDQLVATGYNRLNMMTREGGAQPKEYLAKYGAERVRSVAAAWFGSTFGCAECHDHKFDPIKTRDFYALKSFFADVKQWGVYADYGYTPEPELIGVDNESPFPPEIAVESSYLKKEFLRARSEFDAQVKAAREQASRDPAAKAKIAAWEHEAREFLTAHPDGWITPTPTVRLLKAGKPMANREAAVGPDGRVTIEKALAKGDTMEVTLPPGNLGRLAALRVEALSEETESKLGGAVSVTVMIVGADGKKRKVATALGDATAKRATHRGGVEIFGLGAEWRLPRTHAAGPLQAVWLLETPAEIAPGETVLGTVAGDNVRPLRFALSPFGAIEPLKVASADLIAGLAVTPKKRTPVQAAAVVDAWRMSTQPDQTDVDATRKLFAAQRDLNEGRTWSLVTQPAQPLTVRVLPRGNWQDESGPVVLPSTPSFLPARRESTAEKRLTRLDLAQWIVSKENPITARAVMNRLWQQFFGVGLSAAVDDLGSQGELPSHPELLDWLASEFRDSGWDVKHMIRLIVTSRTYRQSSNLRPELKDADPANRLLASQTPRRLDAEFVRDNALFVAGALNLADIGGPSVKPYQPDGYYEALQFPDRKYVASADDGQWRRGVYMHWQRTFLHPMLANFDAPSRDECAALRTVSNTPQQALTLLNDPTFVEAARLFATRLLGDSLATTDVKHLRRAYQLALAREPSAAEISSLAKFITQQRDYYRTNPADAEKLVKIGIAPRTASKNIADPVELAVWTNVCRVVLNAHETITRY
ncbi:MAG: DUF1553 domain-containing protein [Opitutus sp.]|nr:DUF1553 domain-containing protein [Opitutus sp.]